MHMCKKVNVFSHAVKQFNQDTLGGLSSWLASMAIRRHLTSVENVRMTGGVQILVKLGLVHCFNTLDLTFKKT